MRRAGISFVVLVAVGALPASADAARVELTGTAGPAAEVFPLYRADPGERNRVHVTLGGKGVTITDPGAHGIRFANGGRQICKLRAKRRVFCEGTYFADVRLGDRNDSLTVSPGGNPPGRAVTDPFKLAQPDTSFDEGAPEDDIYANGGTGNDTLRGSAGRDLLEPGPGRDVVDGRGGDDTVLLQPDGRRDVVKGGGGVDEIDYGALKRGVTVDLSTGVAGVAGDNDQVSGIERVLGGDGPDTLIGTEKGDALYGEGGSDHIDGRGGNDYISGGVAKPGGDVVVAGAGDDVVDMQSVAPTATSTVDCGPGADREAGGVDDLLTASCEMTAFRTESSFDISAGPLFAVTIPVAPVGRDATGRTFELACPTPQQDLNAGCTGTLGLSAGASAESYGSSPFSVTPGQRANVRVELSPAGQAAIAAGSPIAVHVTGELTPVNASPNPRTKIDFGWQAVLAP